MYQLRCVRCTPCTDDPEAGQEALLSTVLVLVRGPPESGKAVWRLWWAPAKWGSRMRSSVRSSMAMSVASAHVGAAAPPADSAVSFSDADFKQMFAVDDLVNRLKVHAARSDHDDSWGFDPAPLLSLFTASISQMENYGKELDARIAQTVKEGRVAEEQHKAVLGELEERLEEDLILRIATLEQKANSFTETAVQIGDRLEKIHDTKQRATECGELMQHLDELQQHKHGNFVERTRKCSASFAKNRRCVCEDHHTAWSSFFRGPPFMNDVHKTAKFVKQLRERALDLSSVLGPEAAEMKLNTESYCEELETHLQAEFFAATEQSNYSTMKRCAETLEELSGLHSENVLISNYVGKRYTGWVKKEATKKPSHDQSADSFSSVHSQDADQCKTELMDHYARILKFATQESKVVKRVFPHPERLLGKLVERIFAERISLQLKEMFSGELQDNPLVYCVTLAMAVQETRSLAQQLNQLGTGDVNAVKLANAEIAQYTDSYWEKEVAALGKFLTQHLEPLLDERPDALKDAKRARGLSQDEALQEVQQHNDTRLSGVVTEVENALSGVEAAILRSSQLCTDGEEGVEDRCQNVLDFDRDLLMKMQDYLGSIVLAAACRAEEPGGSSKHGQWHPLTTVRLVTTVTARLQEHYDRAIVANTSADGEAGRNVQIQCQERHHALRRQTQEDVRDVLALVLSGIVSECAEVLRRKQKPEDFLIYTDTADNAERLTAHPTTACNDCINAINAHHFLLQSHLEAENLHSFLGTLGSKLHRMLLDHVYGFQVTMVGGRQFETDMKNYCNCLRTFNHPRVDQQFAVLREVVRLFTARPESLPALLSGKHDGEIDCSERNGSTLSAGSSADGAVAGVLSYGQPSNGPTGRQPTDGLNSNRPTASMVLPNIPKQELRKLLRMRDDFRKERLVKLVTA